MSQPNFAAPNLEEPLTNRPTSNKFNQRSFLVINFGITAILGISLGLLAYQHVQLQEAFMKNVQLQQDIAKPDTLIPNANIQRWKLLNVTQNVSLSGGAHTNAVLLGGQQINVTYNLDGSATCFYNYTLSSSNCFPSVDVFISDHGVQIGNVITNSYPGQLYYYIVPPGQHTIQVTAIFYVSSSCTVTISQQSVDCLFTQ
jgi:hypothetical protein